MRYSCWSAFYIAAAQARIKAVFKDRSKFADLAGALLADISQTCSFVGKGPAVLSMLRHSFVFSGA